MSMMEGMMGWRMGKMKPEKKRKMMETMMPRMMENCLTSMNKEERQKMFTFCHAMLGEMEEKFLKK